MAPYPPAAPLRFDTSMERPEDHEIQTDLELEQTMRQIRETTFQHGGHALRSVHAKSHGLLDGTLTIAPNLPPILAQGLFAHPGSYKVVIRLSTLPGDLLPDSVSTPRGMALKILDVPGPRLPGSEAETDQDFVMVNGPAFAAPTAKKFLGNLKLLAGTTDKYAGAKEVLSHVARATEAMIEAFGGKSPTVVTLGGQPATHILGESFYTQTPFLYGEHIAKLSIAPVSPELTALTGTKLDIDSTPNALRDAVHDFFGRNGAEWELRVQLCTDMDTMPIEDASVAWPEDTSPYITVARITCASQNSWSSRNVARVDDGMAFGPWHGLAAHRPLGSVNRARKASYAQSAAFRGAQACPIAAE